MNTKPAETQTLKTALSKGRRSMFLGVCICAWAGLASAAPDAFYLEAHGKTYGPFAYTNGAPVAIEAMALSLVIQSSTGSTRIANAQSASNEVVITSMALNDEFESNELSATAKYKGKRIVLIGIVESVNDKSLGAGNAYMLHLESRVTCHFGSDKDPLMSLRKGQSVMLRATVLYKELFGVQVGDCTIIR